MRFRIDAIQLALFSLTVVVFVVPQAGFAGPLDDGIRISPISLSANVPGLEISPQLIERLVVRTGLSHSELEKLGLRVGKLSEEDVRKLVDSESDRPHKRYVRYFDRLFSHAEAKPLLNSRVWKIVNSLEPFIEDAISLGGFDFGKENDLRKALVVAAKDGDDPEQIEARTTAHQLFLEAREKAVRKARGHRRLIDELELELGRRVFEKNVGLVVDIRKDVRHPTISPISRVTMKCVREPDYSLELELVFHEQRRKCDDYGVCRIESVAALDEGVEYQDLFKALKIEGRRYLDGCSIVTRMLIDGEEVVRKLPGKFTSHNSVRSP